MIRLITSPSFQLLDQRVKQILSTYPKTTSIEKIDASNAVLSQWLQEVTQPSLWSEAKVVIVYNAFFFAGTSIKGLPKNKDEEPLVTFLEEKNNPTDVIFIYQGEVDERLSLMKLMKKHHEWIALPIEKKEMWTALFMQWQKQLEVNLNAKALFTLIDLTYPDLDRGYQELKKLSVFGKDITETMVRSMVKANLDDNVFALTNHLMADSLPLALTAFKDLMTLQIEPTLLISLIGKHFQLFAKVTHLLNQSMDTFQISQSLKIHEFRIRLMSQAKKRFPMKRIHHILLSLDALDETIKKGRQDKVEALSWWIVQFNTITF